MGVKRRFAMKKGRIDTWAMVSVWEKIKRVWARKEDLLKKRGDLHLGDGIRLRKNLNARAREKKICLTKGRIRTWAMVSVWEKLKRAWAWKEYLLKKGDGLAFERWHPFKRKIKRTWAWKEDFWLRLVQQINNILYISDHNILENSYINRMRKMMLSWIMKLV